VNARMWIPGLLSVLVPALAVASEAGGHGSGSPSQGQWVLLAFTVVNFLIFVGLLRYFTRAPLRDFLASRRKELVEAMAEASKAKAEAERVKTEYEAKAAGLEKTRADLIAEIRGIAENEREKAVRAANEASERLKQDAERTANSDLERARLELRAEAARLAGEIATKEIESKMDPATRSRLLKEFLERVDR
jgi:F-type H+-transporting ATPase subunit b